MGYWYKRGGGLYFIRDIIRTYTMSKRSSVYPRVEKIRQESRGSSSPKTGKSTGQRPRLRSDSFNYDTRKSDIDLTYMHEMVRHPEPTVPPPSTPSSKPVTTPITTLGLIFHSSTPRPRSPRASPLFIETTRVGMPRRRSRKSDSFDSNLSGEDLVTPRRNSEG